MSLPSDPDLPPSSSERRGAWEQYWQTGAAHSCVSSYGDRYGGEILRFWQTVFSSLPARPRVLDIGTGNGALARLLCDARLPGGAHCDAVDVVEPHPEWLTGLGPASDMTVKMYGGVDAAQLPFPAAHHDLVMSQFGIEYAELVAAVTESCRVVKPAGAIAFVMHHAEGRPASLAAIELDHLAWLLRPAGLLECAGALVEPMARASTHAGRQALKDDPVANAAREAFNSIQAELSFRAVGDGADVLFEAREAIAAIYRLAAAEGAAAGQQALGRLRESLSGSAIRLRDLRAHALTHGQVREVVAAIGAIRGREPMLGAVTESGHLMGWTVLSLRD